MPLSRSRDYLSIGEVLETVKEDFPDVSISKIRFLEAEGLIAPERTGSGYRKFYDRDIARLRYILQLQRDHFMPLKVIRERLAADQNGDPVVEVSAPSPDGEVAEPSRPSGAGIQTDLQLDRAGLAEASGLEESQLAGLEDFGLISQGTDYYDGNDLTVAKAARRLFEHGIEPRHLRMYRQWAEREAGLFEQIVSPLARRRDPSSHLQATQTVRELATLSSQVRDAMLRTSLRELL